MASYCVDSNVLLGYSFLQNRWNDHTDRLISTDNSLFLSDQVIYEYCCKKGKPRAETELKWSKDYGKFDDEKARLRKDARMCELEVDSRQESELGPETVSEIFIEEHDVETQVQGKIRKYFEKTLTKDCTHLDVRDAMRDLVERITTQADSRKEALSERIDYISVEGERDEDLRVRLAEMISHGSQTEHPDAEVVADSYALQNLGIAGRLVTGDKGDIYSNRKEINAMTGLSVLYLKDEFAGHSFL
ncbi:hypothetical protein [Haloarcula sebkhae]|uniref:Uncharacterized protein n=2 Tax=Haloarcula sebkhae TaxID=932660 RepID=A0ACC6VND2_9EURY|nr:hypothetical protein [Haloarcula sebkhae]GGK83392.1 hypothetical protein GCM10009067_39550 [Haloarcula sebkhae]